MRHNTTIYYRTSGASSSSAAAPSPNSDLIGVLQIFDESSRIVMKCNCKVHKSCTCFLNLPQTLSIDDLKQSMFTWLETARSLPARAHRYHSEVIRMSYGIQPRKPDGLSGLRNVRFLNLHPVAWGSACCKTCCGTATACLIKPLGAA